LKIRKTPQNAYTPLDDLKAKIVRREIVKAEPGVVAALLRLEFLILESAAIQFWDLDLRLLQLEAL
jgi:hypothetical protein